MSPPTTPHVVPADADISDHPMTLQVLDLSTSNPALLSIKGPESLSSLWGVLTRCKRSLKDGERLENISWRYVACLSFFFFVRSRRRNARGQQLLPLILHKGATSAKNAIIFNMAAIDS